MNRDLKATAQVLGLRDRDLRAKLRGLRLLSSAGELIISPRTEGRLFIDTRRRWNPRIGSYSLYGVVMTTEGGVEWLAAELGINITTTAARTAGSKA